MSDQPSAPATLSRLLQIGIGLCLGACFTSPLSAAFWRAFAREDLALDQPRVDPEAGVEVLFRETEIDDSLDETTNYHTYVRLKVFNARGVAALDKIEIAETRDAPIVNVAARVLRPDGTIIDVPRDSIHAREILRHGTRRVKAKAFSPPGLEPGCIVEYQWDEQTENGISGLQLYFQDEFPTWRVRFRVKPFNYDKRGYELVPTSYRYQIPELRPDAQGFYTFEQSEVPALHEEPWMPPDDMVQPWIVLYLLRRGQKPQEFWNDTGRALGQEAAKLSRPSREMESFVRELLADAADDGEKMRRLGMFCRDEIANPGIRHELDARAAYDRALAGQRAAAETFASREGTTGEINVLLVALARVAGIEARLACVTDRSQRMFRDPLPVRFMLPDLVVAARVGGTWQFSDPGSRHVAVGRLQWKNEGVTALLCDRANPELVQTPRTPESESLIVRLARFRFDASGGLTGAVAVEYRGHPAVALRQDLAGLGPEARAAQIHDAAVSRISALEMGEVVVENLDQPDLPLIISYPVRVPNYALVAGGRLVFPPAFFQRGVPEVFTAAHREHLIYRPYEYREDDTVEFVLPAGATFAGEPTPPPAFALPPTIAHRIRVHHSGTGDQLTLRRTVEHGGMLFAASSYRLVKQAFEHLHHADGFTVVAQLDDP